MKTVGLLGGMSWESTVGYYQRINRGVGAALGGLHSAEIAMVSVDFDPIAKLQHTGDWDETGRLLAEAARSIQAAGADFLLICANTMHKVAPEIEEAIDIPILHIADAAADALREKGIRTVGLLGTAFTMEQDFYRGRLKDKHGIDVVIPNEEDRKTVHDVIYHELCHGKKNPESRAAYLRIIDRLALSGAEAVLLGCTELGLLVAQSDTEVMLLDTAVIHAEKAVEVAVGTGQPG